MKIHRHFLLFFALASLLSNSVNAAGLILCCRQNNDLYKSIGHSPLVKRFDDVQNALAAARPGDGVLLLADNYPSQTLALAAEVYDSARRKKVRLYVEFPSVVPGMEVGQVHSTHLERGVVTSALFGKNLPAMRIVMIPDAHYIPMAAGNPHLVLAKVAGFDEAVYGLAGAESHPLLFEHKQGEVLIATTALSRFISGRFAPVQAWTLIWHSILLWLQPDISVPEFKWVPTARPTLAANAPMPANQEQVAVERGVNWYYKANLFPHPQSCTKYDSITYRWLPCHDNQTSPQCGDGRLGVLEGVRSLIHSDGSQEVVWNRRYDCNGEVAGSLALAGALLDNPSLNQSAKNILEFVYDRSIMTQGDRAKPGDPGFGLIGWNDSRDDEKLFFEVYYGDDNARGLLGSMAAAAVLRDQRWSLRMLQCVQANLQTTGKFGFRRNRLEQEMLVKEGRQAFFEHATISYAPHYQAYLWACFLWAFEKTGEPMYLERALTAIRMTREAYPGKWRWTNGLQQERSRMLLPLAWLVRVQDTAEHRQWLKEMAQELLAYQDGCGAIREVLGEAGQGQYKPPASNQAYGTNEAPLIQSNGDKVCDLLYTSNFALLGLHEASAATGDAYYKHAEDRLAEFLCRIQVKSETHPEVDGAWYRAFDFGKWEFWGSNADAGWGAWCVETGWTQAWITMVLAMRQQDTSLWELAQEIRPEAKPK
jgi:hypothetical protein